MDYDYSYGASYKYPGPPSSRDPWPSELPAATAGTAAAGTATGSGTRPEEAPARLRGDSVMSRFK